MSVRIMTLAWQVQELSHTEKLVLLALADNANDEGVCWPSISTIADKCSMSRRAVMYAIAELESARHLTRTGEGGKTTCYSIHPCKPCTSAPNAPVHDMHPTRAPDAPVPVHVVHPTRARGAPRTIIEPSSEPSLNRHVCDEPAMEQSLQAEYPKFSGRQDWITAIRAACNLVSDGLATPEDLIAGVKRYAAYVAAGGVSEQRYVMTPAKFFTGADRPWRQEWQPPPKKLTAMERIYAATGGQRVIEHE